jgi:hypothetical protein
VTALSQAVSAALLMNVSIVGINQLYDIDIDKVGGVRVEGRDAAWWAEGCCGAWRWVHAGPERCAHSPTQGACGLRLVTCI